MSKIENHKLLSITNINKTLSTRRDTRKQSAQTEPLASNNLPIVSTQVISMSLISEQKT